MPNRLIEEQSPYLLQHSHNPVDWYPWCDEAFERAEKENKPVLVSIGYSACHWCHVMERESFEDAEVAEYMNAHFVCIKVDREEHPDVDHMYMDAVQAISGSGGWPLNVFVTPQRIPFYGGTYFPPRPAYNRPSWLQVMERMNELWLKQPDDIALQAEQMVQHLRQASKIGESKEGMREWDIAACRQMADALLRQADTKYGGFGAAPKFPGTMAISFLLEHYHFTAYEPALEQALLSLDAMIEGGIYDQLGGGIARYSTDSKWLAPHFEKMLYDNALIICALCDAYSITKGERYKTAIKEIIAFAERELKEPTGGYYSALDADSEGEEGTYYTWTWEEWIAALGENDEMAASYFGVSEKGNWEGRNILHVATGIEKLAEQYAMPAKDVEQHIETVKAGLFVARNKKARPQTDDKSLLSWNALMNIALSKAGMALQNEKYIGRAAEHLQWMLHNFQQEGAWMHTWKCGRARIPAKLDDIAYLVQALMQCAMANGDNRMILTAYDLCRVVRAKFLETGNDLFSFSSVIQKDIPVNKVEIYDGATPSANAVMAHSLLLCGMCMEDGDMREQALMMMRKMCATTIKYTYSFAYWAMIMQRYAMRLKTVVCSGLGAGELLKELQLFYLPQCYLVTSKKEIFDMPVLENKFYEGKNSIFVCTEEACLEPTDKVDRALELIKQ